MLYTHTIGRIGKDCQVITGTHGTFMAVDIAVDDYSRGQNITTWVRVRSSRENHVRLAEYLTKGRLILVEGTISTTQWKDRQGESHTQISINAYSIAFVNAGKVIVHKVLPSYLLLSKRKRSSGSLDKVVERLTEVLSSACRNSKRC